VYSNTLLCIPNTLLCFFSKTLLCIPKYCKYLDNCYHICTVMQPVNTLHLSTTRVKIILIFKGNYKKVNCFLRIAKKLLCIPNTLYVFKCICLLGLFIRYQRETISKATYVKSFLVNRRSQENVEPHQFFWYTLNTPPPPFFPNPVSS
jgi:hypothetical protein